MSEPINPPYPQERTPEQHAAVRRRAFPIAACGALFGVGALILLLMRQIDIGTPPNVLAVNLSFCALIMGVGILFYAKGTPGTGSAAAASVVAIITGLIGPGIYAHQTLEWRKGTEGRELENVRLIAVAAIEYAKGHEGRFPPDLQTMLDEHRIKPEDLHSPFGSDEEGEKRGKLSEGDFATWFAGHSDYVYVGGDLTLPGVAGSQPAARAGDKLPSEVIVAYAFAPIMRKNFAVAFVDGRAEFYSLEDAEELLKKCNEARGKMGLKALAPPESVKKAEALATQP